MQTIIQIVALVLFTGQLIAGQQTLWWDAAPGAVTYEFRFGTNAGGTALTRTVAAGTNSAVFTLPAGRWYVRAVSLTSSNGVSDPSNEVVFDVPSPITIRLQLSGSDDLQNWQDETNAPVLVVADKPKRFYRTRVDISQ